MKSLTTWVKERIINLTPRILNWRIDSLRREWEGGIFSKSYIISFIGAVLAVILYLPSVQEALSKFSDLNVIFLGSGGLIGTMLVLAVSLSIIPIQRAVEIFTPSITRIYTVDRKIQRIIIVLAAFCLFSFVLSVGEVTGLQSSRLLPIQVVILAASLDLVRQHHRRVIQLLEPRQAVNCFLARIKKYIKRTQQMVSRLAKVKRQSLSGKEISEQTQELLESSLYSVHPNHYVQLNEWMDELAETALKAIARSETYTVQLTVSAITEIAYCYLNHRKDNLVLTYNGTHMAYRSDIHNVLNPIYEHLSDINRKAVAVKSETTSISVVQALGDIANYITNLESKVFPDRSAPLTYVPLGYLEDCVETAQREALHEVAFQSSGVLLGVSRGAPDNVQAIDVHLPIIERLNKIAIASMSSGEGLAAQKPLKDIMTLVEDLLNRKHFQFTTILRDVLSKLEPLAQLAVEKERVLGSPTINLPLDPVYALTHSMSIAYLVENAISLIEKDESRKWNNPYGEFIEMNTQIYRHFRSVAENVDLGSSFLIWHISKSIKNILRTYLNLLNNPVTDDLNHINELTDQVSWYLSFFWASFSRASAILHSYAEEACNTLAWIGLSFLDVGYAEVAESSANSIASVANSTCKIEKNLRPFNIADLLMPIQYMRLLSEAKDNKILVAKLDKKMEKPKNLQEDLWSPVSEALQTRKKQLEDELGEAREFSLVDTDSALGLLKVLLQKDG